MRIVNEIQDDSKKGFFDIGGNKRDDDSDFDSWKKNELQKELSNFWEEMGSFKR